MIDNLRAQKVKTKEINANIFVLEPNQPKQIDKDNNTHIAHIHEDGENEDLYIHSQFCDESTAMVCKEFCLNFLNSQKKVDMSYYYFSIDYRTKVYLYDIKKTFAGIDVIVKLIEQWKSSIQDAIYGVAKLDKYDKPIIKIGVITEDNDIERRKRELKPILHPDPISEDISSFMQSLRWADKASDLVKAELLKGFDEGKVTICGCTYEYDVRLFVDKKHDMYFIDGELQAT